MRRFTLEKLTWLALPILIGIAFTEQLLELIVADPDGCAAMVGCRPVSSALAMACDSRRSMLCGGGAWPRPIASAAPCKTVRMSGMPSSVRSRGAGARRCERAGEVTMEIWGREEDDGFDEGGTGRGVGRSDAGAAIQLFSFTIGQQQRIISVYGRPLASTSMYRHPLRHGPGGSWISPDIFCTSDTTNRSTSIDAASSAMNSNWTRRERGLDPVSARAVVKAERSRELRLGHGDPALATSSTMATYRSGSSCAHAPRPLHHADYFPLRNPRRRPQGLIFPALTSVYVLCATLSPTRP